MSLETFGIAADLYTARGPEVNPNRPVFTGDVFDSMPVPGVQDAGPVVVVAHPCSMRGAGARLKANVVVATVTDHTPIGQNAWTRGFFDLTPLPDLVGQDLHVGSFEHLGQARSTDLQAAGRLACLSQFGVNLLQQRLIWYLTRLEVETFRLQEAFGHFFEEVDLMEDWLDTLTSVGIAVSEATSSFDTFLSTDRGGRTFRNDLRDPQRRSAVRQACLAEARQRLEQR